MEKGGRGGVCVYEWQGQDESKERNYSNGRKGTIQKEGKESLERKERNTQNE